MATNKAHILVILLTFQCFINTLYGQQFESEILVSNNFVCDLYSMHAYQSAYKQASTSIMSIASNTLIVYNAYIYCYV